MKFAHCEHSASACVCAPLYTLGPDGRPLGDPTAADPQASNSPRTPESSHAPSYSSPHRIQKPSQRSGSIVVPEAIARGLQYEAGNRSNPQELPNASAHESISTKSQDLPRASPLEQAFPYSIGAPMPAPNSDVGTRVQNSASEAEQQSVGLRLGMMGIGGFRAGKDEVGWSGDWPNLHERPRSDLNVPTPPRNLPHGCCSSKPAVSQSPAVTAPSCCNSHAKAPEELSPIPYHGVNAVSHPSCRTCHSENQPTRHPHSLIPFDGPPVAQKYPPLVVYQHPATLHHYHMDINQTTLYTIPPTYATAAHPLTPRQLTFLQQNPHVYSQTVPQHAPFGIVGQVAPPAEGVPGLALAHNCNCGAACECLGCAAHPFNATTRSHVQSLGAILAHGDHDTMSNNHSQPNCDITSDPSFAIHNMPPFTTSHCNNPNISANHSATGMIPQQPPPTTTAQSVWSPSASNSQEGPQVPFLSSEYYTMEIPVETSSSGFSCTDVSGSCQCGDDCACIGCLTHTGHNGIPLDVSGV